METKFLFLSFERYTNQESNPKAFIECDSYFSDGLSLATLADTNYADNLQL